MCLPGHSLPFVNAALTACAYVVLRKAINVEAFGSEYTAGAHFAAILWAVGPAHGLLIDWCMYRVSLNLAMMFLVSTFLQALVNGAVVSSFLATHTA